MGIDLSGWEARSNERASSPDQDSINLRIGRKVSSELKIPNLLNLAHAFLQISQFHFIRAARWSARRGPCLEIPVIDKGISSVSDAIYQTSQSRAVPIPYDPASSIAICKHCIATTSSSIVWGICFVGSLCAGPGLSLIVGNAVCCLWTVLRSSTWTIQHQGQWQREDGQPGIGMRVIAINGDIRKPVINLLYTTHILRAQTRSSNYNLHLYPLLRIQ